VLFGFAVSACTLQKIPPISMTRNGVEAPVKRIVLLPSECGTALCKGLDELVSADLSFRGYEIVDLARLNAVERTRTEVQVQWSEKVQTVRGGEHETQRSSGSSRKVEVHGPRLSDVDVWTLRDELKTMGVDSIVRIRTAQVWGKPLRVVALVRVTRADDARLVASSICELEVGTFDTYQEGAERTTRCALAKVLR
jgi:hypothetical protein